MKQFIFILLCIGIFLTEVRAQQDSAYLHITGIVVEADSLIPIPFASISISHTSRGSTTDEYGHFTLMANELDTLVFSNVGFRISTFVVPPGLEQRHYGLVQVMVRDTVMLDEVVILPWPTLEEFKAAFLSLQPQDRKEGRKRKAQENIQQSLNVQKQSDKFYYDQMRYSRLYELTGEAPPNNFLNPITWSNFIKDWKGGAFER